MRWLQVKALADLLRRRLEKESGTVSEAEVEAYYREQLPRFEEVKLRRVVLPRNNFAVNDKQKFEHDIQRIAAELRERAAHGEDLERLQKEGYESLGFSGLPPVTDVGNHRRVNLPSEVREELFSLQPGEVSKVENETYSFVIYKVEAKWRLSSEQVREEITRELAKQKLERAFKSITGTIRTELNEKYFGTALAQ
jgi:bifunctional DNA-binding transcriptional regulator/antitoxin component of YhaV-PrlF toxin-antitoxin module